jgi:hypothetical protein
LQPQVLLLLLLLLLQLQLQLLPYRASQLQVLRHCCQASLQLSHLLPQLRNLLVLLILCLQAVTHNVSCCCQHHTCVAQLAQMVIHLEGMTCMLQQQLWQLAPHVRRAASRARHSNKGNMVLRHAAHRSCATALGCFGSSHV